MQSICPACCGTRKSQAYIKWPGEPGALRRIPCGFCAGTGVVPVRKPPRGEKKTMNSEHWEKQYKESHQIKCPYCDYVLEDGEEMYPFISMWAEDGEDTCECVSCEKEFRVEEHVDRTWEVSKIEPPKPPREAEKETK